MRLRLYISKQHNLKDYSQNRHIRFAVVDLDRSKSYPTNYVCVLPRQPVSDGKQPNIFSKNFGKDSLKLAKQLLNDALKTESDWEIKAAIRERLKLLEPKSPAKAKCRVCGRFFELKRRYRQRICPECRWKNIDKK